MYEINAVSLRQAVAPERLLGRVNAGIRFAGLVAMFTGSIAAGVTANAAGPRPVLVASACATFAGAIWLALSPVRKMRGGAVIGDEIVAATAAP